jgi:hypothetical protein
MTVEEARWLLNAGESLRMLVGEDPQDPTLIVWLDEHMVMSESVAGWSAGVVEPVCGIDSDYLATFIGAGFSVVQVEEDAVGWEQRGSVPHPEYIR